MTSVNEALLEEMKSARRGLDVEKLVCGYRINNCSGVSTWVTVRDCFLTCGYKLVKQSQQEWEFVKS
ncbi:hypothetical protein AAVH_24769 [Aphelenchoides avenae]|nr:hypothetical protein AAVH_24769 [Aphelenchus avenae]